MKVKKSQNQRKKVGGIINFKNYKFIFFLLIFSFSIPYNVQAKNSISIVRDIEIEFFIQKMIDSFNDDNIKNNFTIKPLIVVNKSMNAFVTGNNKIFIHTGLLENIDSFEELEGIIAHEIGHLKLGHVESRKIFAKKSSKLANIAIFAFIGLSMTDLSGNAEGFILAGNDFLLKNKFRYNRSQEMEADIYSIRALNKQNKSSYGLINFFKKIEKYNTQPFEKNNYYSSHPSSESRLEVINSLSKVKNKRLSKMISYSKLSLDLERLKIKLIAYSKDEVRLKKLEKFLSKKNKNYYNAVSNYINNDISEMLIDIAKLKLESPDNPFIFEMSGNINFYNNNEKNALMDYKKSLNIFDKFNVNPPTLLKLSLAHAYIKTDTKENLKYALKILEEIMPYEFATKKLWRLIGIAATKLKIRFISLIAQAEEEILKKQIQKAKYFATLALRDNNINELYKLRAIDILNIN